MLNVYMVLNLSVMTTHNRGEKSYHEGSDDDGDGAGEVHVTTKCVCRAKYLFRKKIELNELE